MTKITIQTVGYRIPTTSMLTKHLNNIFVIASGGQLSSFGGKYNAGKIDLLIFQARSERFPVSQPTLI